MRHDPVTGALRMLEDVVGPADTVETLPHRLDFTDEVGALHNAHDTHLQTFESTA
jgi:hypothetical protein